MKKTHAPLFMVAQLPFNNQETVKLNSPMTSIMDDKGNLKVSQKNLIELGVWDNLLSGNTSFLEIGCGRGYLIEHLYRNGMGKYYGIEPIKSEYNMSVDKLSKLGKKSPANAIRNTLIEKTNFQKGTFDYIYSYHVFEHLENPLVMLEYGKKWLKKNGKMIITCPNVEGYFPKKKLSEWRCSITSHRWLPGLSTITRALENNGYQVEKFFTYGGYPAPRNLKKNIFNHWLKLKSLGDVMCIMGNNL